MEAMNNTVLYLSLSVCLLLLLLRDTTKGNIFDDALRDSPCGVIERNEPIDPQLFSVSLGKQLSPADVLLDENS
jgi:hypothetical protein